MLLISFHMDECNRLVVVGVVVARMTDTFRLFWGLILKSNSACQSRSSLLGCTINDYKKAIPIETQVSSGVWTLG